jgi:hypothetical protein
MKDGAVTFKGGSIANSTAVRACAQCESRVRARWYGMLRGAARRINGAHGAAHACCGEWCTVCGACGGSGACEYSFVIVGERATPSGRGVLHIARALHDARALVTHRVARVPNRKGAFFGARCMMRRRAFHVIYTSLLFIGACCMLHRRAFRVSSAHVACCLGARCMLHWCALHGALATHSRPAAPLLCGALLVRRACAARSGEGRAVAVAERRRDALVRSPGAAAYSAAAACSRWPRAPRCSTPWRYPAPKQRCVRASAAMRSWGGCRRTGCEGRLQYAWPRRPVRRAKVAWCAWRMAP